MNLARYPEQIRENARKFDVKRSTDSWNKIRDLRHTLIQYHVQQTRFRTREDETIQREKYVRRHVGCIPMLTGPSLAMRTDPLALIRGATDDDHFRDRMGEVDRGRIEVFPKLWNLRPYDKTNGEVTRIPRLTAAYHELREETKGWGDYKKLPEEIPNSL